jgi:hypothetical protein
MLEDLQAKYLDEIRSMFPLHRLILGMLGFVCSLVVTTQTHKSIAESLIHLQLKTFSFDEGNLFEQAEIWNLLLGFSLCFLSWSISSSISRKFLAFLMVKLKVEERIQNKTKELNKLLQTANPTPKEILSHINQQSENSKKAIARLSNSSELCTGICLCFGIASYWGNTVDFLTAAIFFVLSIYATYMAIYRFFSKYIKYDLVSAALMGTRPELELPTN